MSTSQLLSSGAIIYNDHGPIGIVYMAHAIEGYEHQRERSVVLLVYLRISNDTVVLQLRHKNNSFGLDYHCRSARHKTHLSEMLESPRSCMEAIPHQLVMTPAEQERLAISEDAVTGLFCQFLNPEVAVDAVLQTKIPADIQSTVAELLVKAAQTPAPATTLSLLDAMTEDALDPLSGLDLDIGLDGEMLLDDDFALFDTFDKREALLPPGMPPTLPPLPLSLKPTLDLAALFDDSKPGRHEHWYPVLEKRRAESFEGISMCPKEPAFTCHKEHRVGLDYLVAAIDAYVKAMQDVMASGKAQLCEGVPSFTCPAIGCRQYLSPDYLRKVIDKAVGTEITPKRTELQAYVTRLVDVRSEFLKHT